ncbi:DUF2066 domain-containing protein, partial [Stella sp.]|uniref:DUF2066 domain-containing protein n=1 Tax=Stella sp. TaxID=2912054 RepID=UPI0035B1EF2E
MIGQRPSVARRTILRRMLALATVALATLVLAGMPARAQYEVTGNAVDVTAASAVQARERALAEAQQTAARRLMERLVIPAGGTPPRLSAAQAAALVQDVEIADERVTPVRYMATVTVRFRPEAVRRFLSEQGVPYSDRARRPTLVLPVLDLPEGPILFDDRNLWLRAWSERPSDGTLVVPLGDLADVGALTAAQALAGDRARIAALARRYGTDGVAVVRAGRGAGDGVTVATARFAGDAPAVSQRASYPDPDRTFAAAVRGTAQALDRPLAPPPGAAPAAGGGADGADLATAPTGSAEDWVQLRRRIAETPGVERVDVVTLSAGRARLRITHRLGHDRLRQAMAALGVEVEAPA